MSKQEFWIYDAANFKGYAQTVVYSQVEADEYLQKNADFKAISWDEFEPICKAFERETYLSGKVHKIDRDRYWEMLEVLPPENWCRNGGFEHFRMMEYTTGTITTQFGQMGDQYREKAIDVTDKSTWLTAADFK